MKRKKFPSIQSKLQEFFRRKYKNRARNRGANMEFTKRVADHIQVDFQEFLKHLNEKIILENGEYLEDALFILIKNKIKYLFRIKTSYV